MRRVAVERRNGRDGIGLERILATRPRTEHLLGQHEQPFCIHVAGHDQGAVVRHIVLALNLTHLCRSHVGDHGAIADRILATELSWVQQLRRLLLKSETRLRFVTVILAQHDFLLALQFIVAKRWIDQRAGQEAKPTSHRVCREREIIVHAFFLRRAVEYGTEFRSAIVERFGVR